MVPFLSLPSSHPQYACASNILVLGGRSSSRVPSLTVTQFWDFGDDGARGTTARHGTAQLHEIPITHARDGHAHAPTQPPKLHLLISHRL